MKVLLKILKKNAGLVVMYLVIFFAIAIALQTAARKEHLGTFEKTRINIAVADRDQSELSQGLIRYKELRFKRTCIYCCLLA